MVGLMLCAMRVDRLLSEHGIGQDSAAGRQEFERQMERRRLEALDEEALKPLRRGWCLGREQFKEQMLMEGKLDENMPQVLIHPGEDGYWVAECPSLPGCVSRGATREESVRDNPLAQTVVPAHRELDRGTLRCFTPICSQAAKVLVDELPREAFGECVQLAGAVVRHGAVRKREQAPRTPKRFAQFGCGFAALQSVASA
jgi:hypothetical protein